VFLDTVTPQSERDATEAAGRVLGLELQLVEISGPDTFDSAFQAAVSWGAEGLSTRAGRVISPNREKFVALAARYRLPAMYHQSVIVHAGGLMSYGPILDDLYRKVGVMAGKILKGTMPADLPVERPARFEMVVNLKAAKALDLNISNLVLARPDEVIE